MWYSVIWFAVGLVLLIKGGDWFVGGAVSIAKRYNIPEILIGATVVSIGTTIPEVLVSSIAASLGQSQTAYGNAIGSIICNTSLIAAITIAIKPEDKVKADSFRNIVFFFFIAAIFFSGVAYTTGFFSRTVGIVLLCIFVVYMVINIKKALVESKKTGETAVAAESAEEQGEKADTPIWKDLLKLVGGAAIVAVGADLLVDNGMLIAEYLGVPESVVALTFVALGTSLPELVTAITSLAKGHSSLSLGNIIGANLFNLVFVSGIAITIRPFHIPSEKMIGSMNASLVVDIPVMFAVMLILTVPVMKRKRLYRWQGILLLAIYFAYVMFQFFF